MYPILDEQQSFEQAGFRKSFSTIDHLHTVNQLIEKSLEYQIQVHLAFVDFQKAFDTAKHDCMIRALRNQGVPLSLLNIISSLYSGIKASIITDQEGEYFEIERRVKQGDPMSSTIFNLSLIHI